MARAKRSARLRLQSQSGRKGGYVSDRNIDFGKKQSIEELTGGRIKKKEQ